MSPALPPPPAADADATFDDALAAELAAGLPPLPLPSDRAAALRVRLLDRARAARAGERAFHDVRAGGGVWRALARGVRVKSLGRAADSRAVLVDIAAGASLPPHAHHDHEECVVLRGEATLGDLRVGAGDYHVAPAGSRHGRVASADGALLYLRGAPIGDAVDAARGLIAAWLPGGARPQPITVRAGEGVWQPLAPGIRAKTLWSDPATAAQSLLLRLDPGARLAAAAGAPAAGRECLLLDGEAFFGDTLLQSGDYRLAPAGAPRRDLGSDVGALLFVRGGAELPATGW